MGRYTNDVLKVTGANSMPNPDQATNQDTANVWGYDVRNLFIAHDNEFALSHDGDPNGALGSNYVGRKVWDYSGNKLWVCTTAGTTSTAVWADVSGGSSEIITSIKSFGAVGDGVTNDTAAFTAAEASSTERIYIPEGDYLIDGGTTLKKYYHGDGRLYIGGTYYGQTYSRILDAPTPGAVPGDYFGGDITNVNGEYYEVGPGLRQGLDEYYFDYVVMPQFQRFFNFGGHSGISAVLTANASIGATSVTVNGVGTDLQVGATIGFTDAVDPGYNPGYSDTATITGVSGNTITFTPALTSALTAGTSKVTIGARTMNPADFKWVQHNGGGDSYGWLGRIMVKNDNVQPGQEEFIQRATGGMIGGDMYGQADGVLLTPTEVVCLDTSIYGTKQISVIGDIRNYSRNSDNGLYKGYWLGQWQSSIGANHCDAISAASGKWKVGFDTVAVDFTSGGHNQSAINMKDSQRITFNSTSDFTRGPWGNLTGDSYITYSGTGLRLHAGGAGDPNLQINNSSMIVVCSGSQRFRVNTSDTTIVGDLKVASSVGGSNYFRAQASEVNCSVNFAVNKRINIYNPNFSGTAGGLWGYFHVWIDGAEKKVPVYHLA